MMTSLIRNAPQRAISKTRIQACQALLFPKSRDFQQILQKPHS
ncbi:hypothetical protein D3OALGA1CA_24 [Olavius algarvensis associated proteobacterium Delta 3]|nr:hypothetical protein D3OALGA1CA_24 [Olavius algarvensis associated proteobacterium Delta 3]CAB5099468.1 hypothetical protein D3OALGB2SA_1738 [Olavius algarvensis associated proteobacterium Delta 3]